MTSTNKRASTHPLDFDAYLFDIDGTLLNSRDGVHYYAFHAALREVYGLTTKIDGVHIHGNTDVGILRAVAFRDGISADEFEANLPRALERICNEVRRNASQMRPELCPSVTQLLDLLNNRGKILGVISGNLEPVGWLKLQAAGLRRYFSFGSFSGERELRQDIFRHGIREAKRRAQEGSVCIVGDTPSDITAAKSAGAPVIALASGTYRIEALQALEPDFCFSCCTDLLAV
jgi:phosphoglycolate phosphatase